MLIHILSLLQSMQDYNQCHPIVSNFIFSKHTKSKLLHFNDKLILFFLPLFPHVSSHHLLHPIYLIPEPSAHALLFLSVQVVFSYVTCSGRTWRQTSVCWSLCRWASVRGWSDACVASSCGSTTSASGRYRSKASPSPAPPTAKNTESASRFQTSSKMPSYDTMTKRVRNLCLLICDASLVSCCKLHFLGVVNKTDHWSLF